MPWFVRNADKKAPVHSTWFGFKAGTAKLKWTVNDKTALWTSSRQGAENLKEILEKAGFKDLSITHETGGKY